MSFSYFSKNGELLPISQATVSVQDLHFQYGFGVYESLRVRNSIVYFIDMHVDRLLESARLISLEHPFTKEQIITYITEVSKKNSLDSSNIKMLLIGGKTKEESTVYIFPVQPLYPDRKLFRDGATVETVMHQRFMPKAKTLNMLPSYLFFTRARKNGNYDALFLDKESAILEGTRTNFFVIKGNTVITPPKDVVLDGVIRQTLVSVAQKNGYTVTEDSIPLSAVKDFDGAFLTSTSTKILPLCKIDAVSYPSVSDNLKKLMKIYDDFLDSCNGIFRP